MKKLISLLMVLLLVLSSAIAFAETEGEAASTDTPATSEAITTTEGDTPPAESTGNEGAETVERNLLMDGLTVTIIGLAGVFLVLILFFLMIKLMGKMLK